MFMKPEDIKKRVGAFPVASVAVGDIISIPGYEEGYPVSRVEERRTSFTHSFYAFFTEDTAFDEGAVIVNSGAHVRGWFNDAGNLPGELKHPAYHRAPEPFPGTEPRLESALLDYTLKAPITVMRAHAAWMRQHEDVRINDMGDKGWAIGQAEPFRPIMFIKNKKMADATLVLWRRICKEFIG